MKPRYSHVEYHHNSENLQARALRYRRRLRLKKRQRQCLQRVSVVDRIDITDMLEAWPTVWMSNGSISFGDGMSVASVSNSLTAPRTPK